jgi:hypothetical protein
LQSEGEKEEDPNSRIVADGRPLYTTTDRFSRERCGHGFLRVHCSRGMKAT